MPNHWEGNCGEKPMRKLLRPIIATGERKDQQTHDSVLGVAGSLGADPLGKEEGLAPAL